MYIAKVNVETAARKYRPGEKIEEQLSDADIAFLKKHNFIVGEDNLADTADVSGESADGDSAGITPPGTDGDSAEGIEYKDEAALRKLNKSEIVEYAKSIGLSLKEESLKPDLIEAVLNYVEEKEATERPE